MSNFKYNGNDLDIIFMPITTPGATTALHPTNFKVSGQDLQQRYAAYVTGSIAAPETFYKSSNYSNLDLNTVFQYINSPLSPYTTTGTVNKTSDGTYNTILTWTTSGSITFSASVNDMSSIITGSGAGGGHGNSYNFQAGTGGGGSTSITYNLSNPILNNSNSITVGIGGDGGYYNVLSGDFFDPNPGSSSTFNYNSITYSASGGTIFTGGAGGSNNSMGSTSLNNNGGGGGGGGSNTSTQYLGGSINGAGGAGGRGGALAGSGNASLGANGQNGISYGGGGGGGGSNGSGYNPTNPTFSSGGKGANGSVVLKFNI